MDVGVYDSLMLGNGNGLLTRHARAPQRTGIASVGELPLILIKDRPPGAPPSGRNLRKPFILIGCRPNGLNSLRSGGRNPFSQNLRHSLRVVYRTRVNKTKRSIGSSGPKCESAPVLEMAATA